MPAFSHLAALAIAPIAVMPMTPTLVTGLTQAAESLHVVAAGQTGTTAASAVAATPGAVACRWVWDDQKLLPGYDRSRRVGPYLRVEVYVCPQGADNGLTATGTRRVLRAYDRA